MRRILITFVFLIALCGMAMADVPRPEYPRPDMMRQEWANLNGWWEFAFDFSNSGEARGLPSGKGFGKKILVPFSPESELSGIGFPDFMTAVWYKRDFEIPPEWKGRRILLHFEAVDYRATVWVNGKKVGSHEGGYTPFSFDITEYLQEGNNLLVVKAYDKPRSGLQPTGKQSHRYYSYSCLYKRTTGIWQTVWLEPVSPIYIKSYKIFPDIDNSTVAIAVNLNQQPARGTRLILEVLSDGKREIKEEIAASRISKNLLRLKKTHLWSPDDPFLYDIVLTIQQQGKVVDSVKGYFGLRKIHTEGRKILLNNKPLFLRMVLDQGFYPDGIYTAPSDESLRKDIEISKAMGFNGARLHQRVFERRFLYWADRLGYLIWDEFADWGLNLKKPEAYLTFSKQWLEVMGRDFNHPSLIGWCPFNEVWQETYPGLVAEIYRLTKLFDSTRLVIDVSGGFHYISPDVYDAHNYEQKVVEFKAAFAGLLNEPPQAFVAGGVEKNAPYREQPYFVSEYGGIWWNPGQKDDKAWGYGERPRSAEEFIERYKNLTEALLFNPAIAGFCYTQLYDIEQEVNGLYTFWRKPKFDPSIFLKINTQRAAIEK